ncbi:hypothetical protein [Methylobrevis albus]|uniref:Uncharacterized protein n=1 Tax=Methylobrevis albus TaxID=2793297 RepID=A0A931MXL2_9HYPH|nr:hypothetical protein [Methylobrevis albus]MBH0237055.1 hypothetical protein [Methylobrevis albus]
MPSTTDVRFFSLAVAARPQRRRDRWSFGFRRFLAGRPTSYSGGGKALMVADFVEPLPRVLWHHLVRSLMVRDVAALGALTAFATMLAVVVGGA